VKLASVTSQLEPRAAWWVYPVTVFALSRLVVMLAAVLGQRWLTIPDDPALYRTHPEFPLLDAAARWDSAFYLEIARQGYSLTVGEPSSVAFFPLYPLLLKVTGLFIGDLVAAGALLSHLFFLVAIVLLFQLTRDLFDEVTAKRTTLLLCAFPTSFFFSAVYTESLYLLCAVSSFAAARRGRWAWAGLAAMLASGTRIVGAVLCLALLLEYLRRQPRAPWGWVWAIVPLLAPLSFSLFLARVYGDPVAFWSVQSSFGRTGFDPLNAIWRDLEPLFRGEFAWNVPLDLSALLFVLLLTPAVYRRLGAGYAVFTALSVLIPLMSGTGSLSRYALVAFPAFMVVSAGASRWVPWAFLVGLALLSALFAAWRFVA
jgi:hypothetical protein